MYGLLKLVCVEEKIERRKSLKQIEKETKNGEIRSSRRGQERGKTDQFGEEEYFKGERRAKRTKT